MAEYAKAARLAPAAHQRAALGARMVMSQMIRAISPIFHSSTAATAPAALAIILRMLCTVIYTGYRPD